MTQELILGVLLVGIIGLLWMLTLAILGDDQRAHDHHQGEAVYHPSKADAADKIALPHRNVA
jgi:hypothetical protein